MQVAQIVTALGIKVPARDLSHTEPSVVLQAVFSKWLPLGTTVFDMVVTCLPSPHAISQRRVQHLMYGSSSPLAFPAETRTLEADITACRAGTPEKPSATVVFVSKMVAVDHKDLPQNKASTRTPEELQAMHQQAVNKLRQQASAALAAQSEDGFPAGPTLVSSDGKLIREYFFCLTD